MGLDSLMNNTISDELSEIKIHKWDHIISVLDPSYITVKELTGTDADVYLGDFNGLLESFGINNRYWFAHVRLNGFKTSSDYDGRLSIYIIDPVFASTVNSMLNNNSY